MENFAFLNLRIMELAVQFNITTDHSEWSFLSSHLKQLQSYLTVEFHLEEDNTFHYLLICF